MTDAASAATPPGPFALRLAHGRSLTLTPGRPALMGILNATPDSFSDGGRHATLEAAVAHARRMVEEGAAMIDVGGESTRPGSEPVLIDEELRRVLPIVEAVAAFSEGPLISIDTTKAEVARRALDAGAHLVNDVSGGVSEPAIFEVAAERGAGFCVMHMLGAPRDMQRDPRYGDVVAEIAAVFERQVATAERAGLRRASLLLDPGVGFGKKLEHNVALLRRLREFDRLGLPLLLGVSRKSFLARLTGIDGPAAERDAVTQVAHAACVAGGAAMLRVHDVAMARDAVAVAAALFG
jgi:dihydropteroate synthase